MPKPCNECGLEYVHTRACSQLVEKPCPECDVLYAHLVRCSLRPQLVRNTNQDSPFFGLYQQRRA